MATYTDSLGFNKGSPAVPASGVHRSSVVSVTLDFPKIIAARAAAGAPALAPNDVLQVMSVPAGTLVRSVCLVVDTPAPSGTIAIGDGTAPAGYLAAQSVATTGIFGGVPVGTNPLSAGKVYTTADTIDIVIGTAVPSTAVVRVVAEFVNLVG